MVPPGDVLIHAGDFSNIGLPKDVEKFKMFLDDLPHPHKVRVLSTGGGGGGGGGGAQGTPVTGVIQPVYNDM